MLCCGSPVRSLAQNSYYCFIVHVEAHVGAIPIEGCRHDYNYDLLNGNIYCAPRWRPLYLKERQGCSHSFHILGTRGISVDTSCGDWRLMIQHTSIPLVKVVLPPEKVSPSQCVQVGKVV